MAKIKRKKGSLVTVEAIWIEAAGKRVRMPIGKPLPVTGDGTLIVEMQGNEIVAAFGGAAIEVEWANDE